MTLAILEATEEKPSPLGGFLTEAVSLSERLSQVLVGAGRDRGPSRRELRASARRLSRHPRALGLRKIDAPPRRRRSRCPPLPGASRSSEGLPRKRDARGSSASSSRTLPFFRGARCARTSSFRSRSETERARLEDRFEGRGAPRAGGPLASGIAPTRTSSREGCARESRSRARS